VKHSYEYYKKNRTIKTDSDILNLIKQFPGISFTEIQKTTHYNSGNLSLRLRNINNEIVIVRDETRRLKKSNNSKNIKSMYFHIDRLPEIESLCIA
jgi:hypothetical protein